MAGAHSGVLLFLSIVLLSSNSVQCRPSSKPQSFRFPFSSLIFNSSLFQSPNNNFIPRVPKTPSELAEQDQERVASAQILGLAAGALGNILARFGPAVVDCINGFNRGQSTIQVDPQAIINELDEVWRSQFLPQGGTIHQTSAQLQSVWPGVRNCLGNVVGGFSPLGAGGLGETQDLRQNWETASDILDQFLSQQPPTASTDFDENFLQEISSVQQSRDWSVLCTVMDATLSEPDNTATLNTQTDIQKQEALHLPQQATAQSPSLGDLARRYWPTARECLNDFLSDNENEEGDSAAIASEFERIWKRETTEVASSQIRRQWPAIRDCVDRFVNGGTSPDEEGQETNLEAEIEFEFLSFGQSCNDALYIMAFTDASTNAFTIHYPFIELTVEGETQSVQLPGLERFSFTSNKGDLFKIDLLDFGFVTDCIKKRNVEGVAVVEGGTDGWLIDSIVTFLRAEDDEASYTLLTSDIDVDRWVGKNGDTSRKRFDLTFV